MEACCRETNDAGAARPERAAATGHDHSGDDCCAAMAHEIAAMRDGIGRVLKIVLAINAVMFLAEFAAGVVAHSSALLADSVDMLGDALVYAMSMYALGRSDRWRAGAALANGGLIAALGIGIFAEAALKIVDGVPPLAGVMVRFGLIALGANLACFGLLYRFRRRDVNLSSTFECARNDVIANLGVLVAAAGVYRFSSPWPDVLVGTAIAIVFFRSALRILRQAWPQFRAGVLAMPGPTA
jgi:Co/Zn/Cd efflux system component